MGNGWVLLLFAAIAIELHSAGVSLGYVLSCILSACYFMALVASKYITSEVPSTRDKLLRTFIR